MKKENNKAITLIALVITIEMIGKYLNNLSICSKNIEIKENTNLI